MSESESNKRKFFRITKITTKFGDSGETYIPGGFVVSKSHSRIRAYGAVDELVSLLGYIISVIEDSDRKDVLIDIKDVLRRIQDQLFVLGGDLARLFRKSDEHRPKSVKQAMIDWLEEEEEKFLQELEPLEDFIIPGGSRISALIHLARTVARRCETEIVNLACTEKINQKCIVYINRLSDLLFILARIVNKRLGIKEEIVNWEA